MDRVVLILLVVEVVAILSDSGAARTPKVKDPAEEQNHDQR